MILQKLELTNFLSYRETAVLDFQGIQLACISGANGAGKSSILDGITWALFGRSRSRSDDDLINRLAAIKDEAAEVRFTFSLEGITYRILRRKRPGKAVVLELQINAGEDDWKTLSERKSRETQAQIEHLLRMNYDTFTNASFLLQGKADQFTTHTANKRKEILAELLGVTIWEQYREAAAARRKKEEGQAAIMEARLDDIQEELNQKEARERDLEEAGGRRTAITEKLALQERLLRQVRQTAAAVEQQKVMVQNLAGSVQRIKRDLKGTQETLEKRQQEKVEVALILAEKESISAAHKAWQVAEATVQSWQAKASRHNDLKQQMQPFVVAIAETRSGLEQKQRGLEDQAQRVREAQDAQPARKEAIQGDAARLQEIEDQLANLAALQDSLSTAQARLQELEGQRKLAREELARLENQERRMKRAAEEKEAVLANREEATAQLAASESAFKDIAKKQDQYILTKADLDILRGQQQLLRQEMDRLKERIVSLQRAELDSQCPTCGQPLSSNHRRDVLADLQQEGRQKGDQYRTNKERIGQLEIEVDGLQGSFRQKERLERDQQTNQQRLAKAEARLGELEQSEKEWQAEGAAQLATLREQQADDAARKAQGDIVSQYRKELEPLTALRTEQKKKQDELSKLRAAAGQMDQQIQEWQTSGLNELQAVNKKLERQDYALEARAALAELQTRLEGVGYDADAHQEAIAGREVLAAAPDRFQALKQAQAAIRPLNASITELRQRAKDLQADVEAQEEQLQTAETQLQTLVEGSSDLRQLETVVFDLREEENKAIRSAAFAQQKLEVLQDLQKQKDELEQEKKGLSTLIRRLKVLESSCSRKGVQALLIEHALPEIEERANQLIERLTGGDMRIYFDTQRQLKSRDALAETLDIRIEDKDGVRPYDNYSGGEQFRVNFAIRLALSQLLAHRAGARLQTLVVDEGFGSQDPQGRQRLVEAINAVRDEFACILVITHIAELRDAFSTRIEVQKGLNGSVIEVV